MNKYILLITTIFVSIFANAQTVNLLTKGTKTSMRGLSVVTNNIVWASGSAGTVAKSIDGGKNWQWLTVKGFEKTDFRDIEAFDANTAIIMGIDTPAVILKTIDGGQTWKTVYNNTTKGMFLDAMDFYDAQHGIVVGDPINGKFFVAATKNGGNTWQELDADRKPNADSGEACFASSGTNIRLFNKSNYMLASGGLSANFLTADTKSTTPILQGKESTGNNSIAFHKKKIILVGGDFNSKDSTTKNCFVSNNFGKTWAAPTLQPSGYRSCIEFIAKKTWVTCGLNGSDITHDDGNTFTKISTESFHVCRKAKKGTAVFFAGGGGRIGKLLL